MSNALFSSKINIHFFLLPHKGSFGFMKNCCFRFSCQDTQNNVKRPEKSFRKCPEGCVSVCVRACTHACECVLKLQFKKIQVPVSQKSLS